MKKCAVINDLSGFGKCSLTAALPIISAMGVEVHPLLTAVLSNQTAYDSYKAVSLTGDMKPFYDEWKKLGASFDSILTGFVTDEKQLDIISDFIGEFKTENTLLVVDPIMADNGKLYDGYDENMCKKIIELCYKADVITPNIAELAVIAGMPFSTYLNDIMSYGKMLIDKGIKRIVASGFISCDEISNIVFEGDDVKIITAKKHGSYYSGTGDILSSVICAGLTKGMPLCESTELATAFIEKAVESTDSASPNDGVSFEKHIKMLIEGCEKYEQ